MHEQYPFQTLLGNGLYLLQREPQIPVILNELVQTLAQCLEYQACVFTTTFVVDEVLVEQDQVVVGTTFVSDVVQDLDFYFGTGVVAGNATDYLHGVVVLVFYVLAFQGSTECSVAQMTYDFV